jgi:hypothetical protein
MLPPPTGPFGEMIVTKPFPERLITHAESPPTRRPWIGELV